ncbi:MAG: SH3 domain-containing protein [Actinomycetota bacterium]
MSGYSFASYQRATDPTSGPTSGARALMAYTLSRWPYARSMGIYNVRNTRGGASLSHHAEGRALDIGIPQPGRGRADAPKGDRIVEALGRHGRRLGIDHLIWNRRIWSTRSPGGRNYTGTNPHHDHIHLGLTRSAAGRLNLATLIEVLGRPTPGTHEHTDPAMTHEVTASSLRIRSVGTTTASILGELPHRTQVEVLDSAPSSSDGHEWVQVRADVHGRELSGWVASEFLEALQPPPPTHRVRATSLRLRSGPTTGAAIILDLTDGTPVVLLDDDAREADGHQWVRVRARIDERDETGWVAQSYLGPIG